MSIATLQEALEVNNPEPGDPVDVLAKVGGFEIGVIAGVVLGGAMMRRVVVLAVFIPARFFIWVQPSSTFPG
jgi:nicotinate-nucleotide--dimethylbenzimidazole phosphoribosyltransferase